MSSSAKNIARGLSALVGLAVIGGAVVAGAGTSTSYDWARESRRAAARSRRLNAETDLAKAKSDLRYEEGREYRFRDYSEIGRLRSRVWQLESDLRTAEREERYA